MKNLKNKKPRKTKRYSENTGYKNKKLLSGSRTVRGYKEILSEDIILNRPLGCLVTVVVTNYNKKRLLIDCVKSVLGQSHRQIEVIVIDDCSNDDVIKLLSKISDKRLRIVLNEKNYGPYACRNYALGIAKGKYITFLDADDTIDEDHILLLLSCIKKRNLIGVISLYNRYSTSGKKVKGPNICEASIMFDIKDVLKNIGYYHMVRCGGDTEFRERMAKHYERSRMGVFYHTTYSALYSKASLTRSPKLGGGTKARQEYAGAFRRWHKGGDSLFFDYRTMDMPFDLNKEIRVTGFNTKSFKGVKR